MKSRPTTALVGGVSVLVLLILVGLTYANYGFTKQNPGGNDFLSRWVGTRLFLTRGLSPYSEQATEQIHEMAYGRDARSDEDQMLFAYPFYTTLVIAPFALVGDYGMARALWMTALEACLVLIAAAGLVLNRWRPPAWLLGLLLVFALLWYHGLRPVINGNPSIFVTLFIVLAFWAIRAGHDPLAGLLLALATIKPQMVVLLIPLVLFWAISHRRWSIVASFWGSLALLIATFTLFIPDWILQNIRQILSYPLYTLPSTPGGIFAVWVPGVGKQLGWGLAILLAIVLLWEWRLAMGSDFRWLMWVASLTLVITNLIGIPTATENYVAMFPALILMLAIWDERWRRVGRGLVVTSLLVLFVGLWYVFIVTLQPGDQPIQHPFMFFPVPVLLLAGLYWVRWWAIRPPRVFLDQLRQVTTRGS